MCGDGLTPDDITASCVLIVCLGIVAFMFIWMTYEFDNDEDDR
jgi:hypothetical protein